MTETRNREKRDQGGKFLPGTAPGPGRPKGSENVSTVTGKKIKAAVLASWDQVNGPQILRDLARDDPKAYLDLVTRMIRRESELPVSSAYLTDGSHERDERRRIDQERSDEVCRKLFNVCTTALEAQMLDLDRRAALARIVHDFAAQIPADYRPELPTGARCQAWLESQGAGLLPAPDDDRAEAEAA